MTEVLMLSNWKQKDHEFKARLGYTVSSKAVLTTCVCLQKKKRM